MPSTCLICKKTAKKGSNASMYRIPPKSEAVNRQKWLVALNLTEDDVLENHRICSKHFRNGDSTQIPTLHLGAQFASPKKAASQRCKTSRKRKNLSLQYKLAMKQPNTSPKATHECACCC